MLLLCLFLSIFWVLLMLWLFEMLESLLLLWLEIATGVLCSSSSEMLYTSTTSSTLSTLLLLSSLELKRFVSMAASDLV